MQKSVTLFWSNAKQVTTHLLTKQKYIATFEIPALGDYRYGYTDSSLVECSIIYIILL